MADMDRMALNRETLLARMSAHVLQHGLQTASLRPLAAAAGTSDRMLIYHFGSRDALLMAVLDHIATTMAAGLDQLFDGQGGMSSGELLRAVWGVARNDEFRPAMRIWLELVAIAARDPEGHGAIATRIADGFLVWTTGHLKTPDEAPLVLTCFEGMLVLQEAGHGATVDAAIDTLCARLTS